MNAEQQLITDLYSVLRQRNWKALADCYHEEVFYYDPVFGSLEGPMVSARWEMLLTDAADLRFGNIEGGDGYGSCEWAVTYVFPPTGRKVVHAGRAHLYISGGRIAEHQDDFDLWKWSSQALGMRGLLFGWSSALQAGIRKQARAGLEKFMAARSVSM